MSPCPPKKQLILSQELLDQIGACCSSYEKETAEDGTVTVTLDPGDGSEPTVLVIPPAGDGSDLTFVDADGQQGTFDPENDCIPRGAFQRIADHESNTIDAAGCGNNPLTLHRSLVIEEDHVAGATGVGGANFIGVSSTDSGDGPTDVDGVTTHHLYTAVSARDATVSGVMSIVSGNQNVHSGARGFTTGFKNETSGVSAISAGVDNVNNGNNSLVAGSANNISGSANGSTTGQDNVLTNAANNNVVTGSANQVDGSGRGFMAGTENSVTAASNNGLTVGESNVVNDSGRALVGGWNHTVDGSDNSLIIGRDNSIIGHENSSVLSGSDITTVQADTAHVAFLVIDPAWAPPAAASVPGQVYQPGGPGTALFW